VALFGIVKVTPASSTLAPTSLARVSLAKKCKCKCLWPAETQTLGQFTPLSCNLAAKLPET